MKKQYIAIGTTDLFYNSIWLRGNFTDSFVVELKMLAKTFNFCDCLRNSLIRDRIVLGIKNEQATILRSGTH